jgi:imidazolonepropionase-like amidohydrolase
MHRTQFTHVRVFDGAGEPPFAADVLVEDQRIVAIHRDGASPRALPGASVIDGNGATLMPGLTEPHAHLSWPSSVERFLPGMTLDPEYVVHNTARTARILIDHGFTSAYSGGALANNIEVVLKACIDSGGMPGPRLVASSIERELPSATTQLSAGHVEAHGSGPDAVRAFVKQCAGSGAKVVKLLLSESDVWLTGHAHAAEAIKMELSSGFRVLYHCIYADAEAIDMLEAKKIEIFVAPTVGIAQAALHAKPPPHFDMTHIKADAQTVIDHQRVLVPELKKRGVRILPGGDYGFPFNPTGRNARDQELFVRYLGYTPSEALQAATRLGGQIMGMGNELGQIKVGYLADLLLVDGDPTLETALLQDRSKLLPIMKAGRFHKAPKGFQ